MVKVLVQNTAGSNPTITYGSQNTSTQWLGNTADCGPQTKQDKNTKPNPVVSSWKIDTLWLYNVLFAWLQVLSDPALFWLHFNKIYTFFVYSETYPVLLREYAWRGAWGWIQVVLRRLYHTKDETQGPRYKRVLQPFEPPLQTPNF